MDNGRVTFIQHSSTHTPRHETGVQTIASSQALCNASEGENAKMKLLNAAYLTGPTAYSTASVTAIKPYTSDVAWYERTLHGACLRIGSGFF